MRPEKQLLLDEINELIDKSSSMIVTRYNKLSPQISWEMSKDLSQCKSQFKVVKKRIFYKAISQKNLPFDESKYAGHVGILFIEGDPLEATKTIVKYKNETDDFIEILTGQIDGKVCSSKEIEMLSTLPSLNEMRAQFIGLLEAPLTGTLSVMESIMTSVLYCLDNKKEKELEA